MVNEVNKIISLEFNSIIADGTNTMLLLGLYSKLYLNGQEPRTCKAQMFKYFNELKKTGIMQAEILEKVKVRTCKLKRGIVNIKGGATISDEFMYDELALNLLKNKSLQEGHFEILPEAYKKKTTAKKAGKKTKKA